MSNADKKICARSRELCDTLQTEINALKPDFGTEEYYIGLEKAIKESRGEELSGFLSPQVFKQSLYHSGCLNGSQS